MGFGGISIWQLLIVLVIVLLLFGTKRLKNIGSDLGNAVKGFRGAMKDEDEDSKKEPEQIEKREGGDVYEGEVTTPRKNEKEKS